MKSEFLDARKQKLCSGFYYGLHTNVYDLSERSGWNSRESSQYKDNEGRCRELEWRQIISRNEISIVHKTLTLIKSSVLIAICDSEIKFRIALRRAHVSWLVDYALGI